MAENLNKRPSKGILKNSSSFDIHDKANKERKATKGGAKFDEMNIMATYHPAGKDYGHMKIDEPKTPYNYELEDAQGFDGVDAAAVSEKLKGSLTPKALQTSSEEEEDEDLTEEERVARKDFEHKRKKHYNEFYAVKLARKLMAERDEEDSDEEDEASKNSKSNQ